MSTDGDGVGVRAVNANGNGADITGSGMAIVGRSNSYPLMLTNASGTDEFYVTGTGNIYANGTYNSFVHTRNGDEAVTFTARSTTASLEDTGTAELTGGSATVRFDPTFAASIDAHAVYQVFLTPGGDTRGLYVARKTRAGFVVRETSGGHGTLSFDYRIVAAAWGHAGDRMSIVSAVHEPSALPSTRAFPMPMPLPLMKKHVASK